MYGNRFLSYLAALFCFLLVLINYSLPVWSPVLAAREVLTIDYVIDMTELGSVTVTGTVRQRGGGEVRLCLPATADILDLTAEAGESPVDARIIYDPAVPEKTGLFFRAVAETFRFSYLLGRESGAGEFGFACAGDLLALPAAGDGLLRISPRLPAGISWAGPAAEIRSEDGAAMPLIWGRLRWPKAEAGEDAARHGVLVYGEMLAAARSGQLEPEKFTAILGRMIEAYRSEGEKEAAVGVLTACRMERELRQATSGKASLVGLLDTFRVDGILRLPDRDALAAASARAGGPPAVDWAEWTGAELDGLLADGNQDGWPDLAAEAFGREEAEPAEVEGGPDSRPPEANDGEEDGAIRVTVDGRLLAIDVPPLVESGRVMLPLRALFEAFGVRVEWDEAENQITGAKDGVTLRLRPGFRVAWVGDVLQRLEVAVRTVRGRAFVPLRFVAETLGCRVDWEKAAATVRIRTEGESRIVVPAVSPFFLPDSGAPAKGKVAYLTFDDGPHPSVTPRILATLEQYGIRATFFVLGSNAEKHPALLQRIAAAGHGIGNHTYSHSYQELDSSVEAFLQSVVEAETVIQGITGRRPSVFRAPGGSSRYRQYGEELFAALRFQGYRTFDWNVTCVDSAYPRLSAAQLLENVKYYCRGQKAAIVLMHDASTHEPTAEALPLIIEYLIGEGYVFDILRPDNPLGK